MARSRFSGLEQRLSASVDNLYAETLALEPRAGGEYANTADPDRAGYDFAGVVDFKPHLGVQTASNTRMNDFASINGDDIHVSIRIGALPADRARWPKQGDVIVLPERPEEKNLKIAVVEPDGLGRILCRCTRTSR